MGGIVLYVLTLIIESISILVRFAIVGGLTSLVAGQQIGLAVGAAAGFAPIIYSLLVVAGIPSGHILVRRSLDARPITQHERALLEQALIHIRHQRIPIPRRIFTVEADGLNAAISGRTLYIYRDLFKSPFLAAVIAHELGHFNSMDGRLLLGIRAFIVPGGFFIAYILLGGLRWVAYGISTFLIALLIVIFHIFRISIGAATGFLFKLSIQLTRLIIIFAVGGVGPALLGSIWRSYLLEREFVADAYAGQLGYAHDLMSFFQTEVLSDVAIPWYEQPTHPSATQRLTNLAAVAAKFPQVRSGSTLDVPSETQRPRATQRQASAAALGISAQRRPIWVIALLIVLVSAITASALIADSLRASPANISRATPGPTPTLGLYRGD